MFNAIGKMCESWGKSGLNCVKTFINRTLSNNTLFKFPNLHFSTPLAIALLLCTTDFDNDGGLLGKKVCLF